MDMYPERLNDGDRSSGRRQMSSLLAASLSALIVAMSSFAAGCRGGATSFAAPSWWSLGGTNPADAAKLTAAPPFEGKAGAIEKPSVSAIPYPTTTTPTSYAVADLAKGSTGATPPVLAAAVEQQPVIYGTTPPPQAAQPPALAGNTIPQKVGEPQVGPYANLSGQPAPPTAGPSTPPMATATASAPLSTPMAQSREPQAASTGSAFPATAGYEPVGTRVADSRGVDPYRLPAGPSDALPAGAEASRYSNSSRFGGGQTPAVSAAPPIAPMTTPTAPMAAPPIAPMTTPTAPMAAPTAPPVRRPDPGYRPASTSSYRPSQAILVESAPASPPSAVRTAAYEVPAMPER